MPSYEIPKRHYPYFLNESDIRNSIIKNLKRSGTINRQGNDTLDGLHEQNKGYQQHGLSWAGPGIPMGFLVPIPY